MIQDKGKLSQDNYDLISDGRFAPYSVSDEIIDDFYEKRIIMNEPNVAKDFPELRINEIYDSLILKPLEESNVDEALKSEVKPVVEVPKPYFGKPSAVTNIIRPNQSNVTNTNNVGKTIATELLGSNPIEAAKNLQILL